MTVYSRAGDNNLYVVQNGRSTVPTPGAQTLYGMAANLLALTKSTFTGMGLELPSREVIYPSPIVADTEQVAVVFAGWLTYPASEGPVMCESFRWLGDFSVIITRCSPAVPPKTSTTGAVTADKMIDAALLASQDAEALLIVLQELGEFASPQLATNPPNGGLQTTELSVQIPAGGI